MKRAFTFATGAMLTTVLATTALGPTTAAAAPADTPEPTGLAQLGPTGYKSLRLGQQQEQAEATGLLVDKQTFASACTMYYLRPEEGQQNVGSGVWIDDQRGVVMISTTDRSRTPENIGLGSTLKQARAAYPKLRQNPETDFVYTTPTPGNAHATYALAVDKVDRLADLTLSAEDMGSCV